MIRLPKNLLGFTLIELLVVISIIGIILSLAFVSFQETKKTARDTQRKADLEDIRSSLEVYKADCGDYPATLPVAGLSLKGDGSSSTCPTINTYMFAVPNDPSSGSGRQYYYGRLIPTTYELCGSLENNPASPASCDDACGGFVCNYRVDNP